MKLKLKKTDIENAKLWRRERPISDHIPYCSLMDSSTVRCRNGALLQVIRLGGISSATTDPVDLAIEKMLRQKLFHNIANSHITIYCHTIRRLVGVTLDGNYPNGFASVLNAQWQLESASDKTYVNESYLTVVIESAVGVAAILKSGLNLFYKNNKFIVDRKMSKQRDKLHSIVQKITTTLCHYRPLVLGEGRLGDCPTSEPLEFLSYLINGHHQPVRRPRMDLARYLPNRRPFFFPSTMVRRGSCPDVYSAIVAIDEYSGQTHAGMLDELLSLPYSFTITQSFRFISRQSAIRMMNDKSRLMVQAGDDARTLESQINTAVDQVASGEMSLGYHQLLVMVSAESENEINQSIMDIDSKLSALGLSVTREDIYLEGSFWSQLPGNYKYEARSVPITTHNFAGFCSLHNQPIGQRTGNHWGDAVTVLKDKNGSPFYFNFHVGDVGMTFIVGRTGGGKTLLMTFLLSQSMKYNPRIIYFDAYRGAELFIRAVNGQYSIVSPDHPPHWNPLLLPDNGVNRSFLRDWLGSLLSVDGVALTSEEWEVIEVAIDSNFAVPDDLKRLTHVAESLGPIAPGSLSSRLSRWYGGGPYAWLFDHPVNDSLTQVMVSGFDMTFLLNDSVCRGPAFSFLYHQARECLTGHPTIIVIDEGWAFLRDSYFAANMETEYKTIRRKNGMLLLATNDPADAVDDNKTGICSTITNQTVTSIFFANPKANTAQYKQLGLNDYQISLVKNMHPNERGFLLVQDKLSVILTLDMTHLKRFIPVLSTTTKNVLAVEKMRHKIGDTPDDWLPILYRHGET